MRIRIGGSVAAAQLVHQVLPVYPPIAKVAHVSGTVVLHCVIDKDGSVKSVEAVSGPPLLVKAAMDAVSQWKYKPTKLNGTAVEVDTTVDVVFTLDHEPQPAAPADYSQEPFIYEQVRGKIRFENDGTGVREAIARLRVQTPAGLAKAGQLVFDYNAANERIEIRSVRVTKPDGSVVTVGPSAVQDLSAPVAREAPMYTDARQEHVTVPGVAVGDIIEYDVATTTFKPLQPGQFWQTWTFIADAICLDEQLDLDVPGSRPLKLKSPAGLDPVVRDEGDRRIYHWATSTLTLQSPGVSNLATNFKFDAESMLEGVRQPPARGVMFSTFQTWDEVGKWYSQLERDRRVPSPEIRDQADQIVKGQATGVDKVRALYEWVSRNVRYVSLSFGTGRYQPHDATEVLQNRYGDCKDKTTLLEAFLEAESFHGSPVLINSKADIDPDVPSPLQFDHAILFVSVDGHDYWLDSTLGVGPFGYLLPQLRAKNALVASADEISVLRKTPQTLPNPTLYQLDVQGSEAADGKVDAKLGFDTRGDLEVLMRIGYMNLSPAQLSTLMENMERGALEAQKANGDISFSDLKGSDPTDTRNPFHLEVRVRGTLPSENPNDTSSSKNSGARGLAQLQPLLAFLLPEAGPSLENQVSQDQLPIKLQGPREYSLSVTFTLPAGKVPPSAKPVLVAISKDFAEYKADSVWEGQTFRGKWRLNLSVPEVPASGAKEYAKFVEEVTASLVGSMPKTESSTSKTTEVDLGPPLYPTKETYQDGITALNQRDYKTAERDFEKVVEQEPRNGDAWNDLGRAYLSLRRIDKAEGAFHQAISINPDEKYAYNNLGRALWLQHKKDEAITAFQKEIAINPNDRFAHANLGSLYLETEEYYLARKELVAAASIAPNNAHIQAELGRAHLELNEPDKARQSFDRALELTPSPPIWNEVAYYMSLEKMDLDRAENYAESAISSTSALLRNISLDHVAMTDIAQSSAMASYWDTLGWVKFQQGDIEDAEKYVKSAWTIQEVGTIGDHLAEIYEKEGRTPDAIVQYELALAASQPSLPATRQRLAALLGSDEKIDSLVAGVGSQLAARRTVKLENPGGEKGDAEFWVLFESGKTEPELKFISGDEKMSGFEEEIRGAKYPVMFPDTTNTKLLRRGTLACPQQDTQCTFVLIPTEDVRSVDDTADPAANP